MLRSHAPGVRHSQANPDLFTATWCGLIDESGAPGAIAEIEVAFSNANDVPVLADLVIDVVGPESATYVVPDVSVPADTTTEKIPYEYTLPQTPGSYDVSVATENVREA